MKQLLILGAGTAGTLLSNQLRKKLSKKDWEITIISQSNTHYYQPGYLFLPFDTYKPEQLKKEVSSFIPKGVNLIVEEIDRVDKDNDTVQLKNNESIPYDLLVIATGVDIAPQETEGMMGDHWYKSVFDFYSFDGAKNLRDKLRNWEGGKLVVHISEMPIKCPVAPLEFAFLADYFFVKKNMRDKVEITYVTPMSGAFTKPVATKELNHMLKEKNIKIVPDFNIEKVDNENKKIVDYGGEEVEYDLLVTVPTNMGDEMIERSGFGDELNLVPTDKNTLQSKVKENIFAAGDANDIPASKAGAVVHFQSKILVNNIVRQIEGKELLKEFDGHSNCFIESGYNKAILIDFNYDHEPVKGTFPIPWLGPLKLLKETRINHWAKLAFRWIYWHILIKGRHIPFVTDKMRISGKKFPK
jgi:sulfide:quinone oxidoreductase